MPSTRERKYAALTQVTYVNRRGKQIGFLRPFDVSMTFFSQNFQVFLDDYEDSVNLNPEGDAIQFTTEVGTKIIERPPAYLVPPAVAASLVRHGFSTELAAGTYEIEVATVTGFATEGGRKILEAAQVGEALGTGPGQRLVDHPHVAVQEDVQCLSPAGAGMVGDRVGGRGRVSGDEDGGPGTGESRLGEREGAGDRSAGASANMDRGAASSGAPDLTLEETTCSSSRTRRTSKPSSSSRRGWASSRTTATTTTRSPTA